VIVQLSPISAPVMPMNELIGLAYADKSMSQKDFEALVRSIYGDIDEECE